MRWPTAFVADDCRPQASAYNRAVRTLYRASRVHTFSLPPEGEWLLIDGRHVERVGSGDPPAADRVVEIIGHAGAKPGEFNNPWSIAFDSKGNLYVADSQNHRVQKFIRKKQGRSLASTQ